MSSPYWGDSRLLARLRALRQDELCKLAERQERRKMGGEAGGTPGMKLPTWKVKAMGGDGYGL